MYFNKLFSMRLKKNALCNSAQMSQHLADSYIDAACAVRGLMVVLQTTPGKV